VDLISTLPIGSLGATGILAVVVLLILRGNLIPRSVHEDRIRDKDAEVSYYQQALEREQRRGDVLAAQNETLMEVGKTAEHVLNSLPTPSSQEAPR
jgi:hypothetical protein